MRTLIGCAVAAAAACGTRAGPPATPAPPMIEGATLVIHADRVLDVVAGEYLRDALIVMKRDRITAVGARGSMRFADDVRVIELGDAVAMPGLIDAHVHLALGSDGHDAARKTLDAGFTTVRD